MLSRMDAQPGERLATWRTEEEAAVSSTPDSPAWCSAASTSLSASPKHAGKSMQTCQSLCSSANMGILAAP
jgi:hypothetical protein